jgi:hypothetical protein
MFMRLAPLSLALLAVLCVVIAALTPVSRFKGQVRLLGSLLAGVAFCTGSVVQIAQEHRQWPGLSLSALGGCLIWFGLRKYSRDPEGKTPSASIL